MYRLTMTATARPISRCGGILTVRFTTTGAPTGVLSHTPGVHLMIIRLQATTPTDPEFMLYYQWLRALGPQPFLLSADI